MGMTGEFRITVNAPPPKKTKKKQKQKQQQHPTKQTKGTEYKKTVLSLGVLGNGGRDGSVVMEQNCGSCKIHA